MGPDGDDAERLRLKCRLIFRLCRRHTWGSPIPQDRLLRLSMRRNEFPLGREICEELKYEPYVTFRHGGGFGIKNDPTAQARVAWFLRERCGYTELQIEATLSRFAQAGGFSVFEHPETEDRCPNGG